MLRRNKFALQLPRRRVDWDNVAVQQVMPKPQPHLPEPPTMLNTRLFVPDQASAGAKLFPDGGAGVASVAIAHGGAAQHASRALQAAVTRPSFAERASKGRV
jgi:hypothetical protein